MHGRSRKRGSNENVAFDSRQAVVENDEPVTVAVKRDPSVNQDFLSRSLVAVSPVMDQFPVPDQLIEDFLDPLAV